MTPEERKDWGDEIIESIIKGANDMTEERKDGKTKDWWIGYFIGALNGIAFRQETPPDVKIQALKTIQGYEEWEKQSHE